MANVGNTSAQEGVLVQHPVVVPEMSNFEDVRQAIANVFATFQQSLHSQFPLTNFQGKRITNVAPPTAADDVVTLKYLQSNQPSQRNSVNPFQQQPSGSGGSNLWTQNNQFLYPTATFTTCVIVGAASSDFFGGPGQLGTTAAIGMMTSQTNASLVYLFISPGIETQVVSNKSGTGTQLPLSFYAGGFRAVVQTTGDFIVGARTTDMTTGTNVISVGGFVASTSASSNASTITISIFGSTAVLGSNKTGTGTVLPLTINIPSEICRFTTAGAFLIGLSSTDFANQAGQITTNNFVSVVSATTNASTIDFHINGTTETVLVSSKTGTGTFLPLSFYTNNVRQVTITVGGAMLLGILTSDAAATNRVITIDRFVCVTAATNASSMFMGVTGGTETFLAAGSTGTGTNLPMSFYLANSTRQLAITVNGEMIAGGSVAIGNFPQRGRFITIASGDFIVTTALTGASSWFQFAINPGTSCNIQSNQSVSGTQLPIWFVIGGIFAAGVDTNKAFLVGMTTSDASATGRIIAIDRIVSATASTNATTIFMGVTAGTETFLVSGSTGTGTSLPMSFYVSNSTRACTITTAGGFIVGEFSSDFFTGHCLVGDANSGMGLISAATNADVLLIREVSNLMQIDSSHSGTGTTRPLQFAMTETEIARFTTAGAFLIGITSTDFSNSAGQITASLAVSVVSAATNASTIDFHINGTTETLLVSSKTGTGTFLPLSFYTSNVRAWTIATGGALISGSVTGGSYGGGGVGRVLTAGDFVITSGYTANESFLQINMAVGTESVINSSHIGTGTDLQISIYIGSVLRGRFATNGAFLVGLTSSDASSAGSIISSAAQAVVSATTNASTIAIQLNGATETVLQSGATGTGTFLPLSFYTSNARRMTILAGGKVLINRFTDDGTGAQLQVSGTISSNGTVITVP